MLSDGGSFAFLPPTLIFLSLSALRSFCQTTCLVLRVVQIAADYAEMRRESEGKGRDYITARTLMSLLRLSQALARIRLSGEGGGDSSLCKAG